jgi:hypothetical protein
MACRAGHRTGGAADHSGGNAVAGLPPVSPALEPVLPAQRPVFRNGRDRIFRVHGQLRLPSSSVRTQYETPAVRQGDGLRPSPDPPGRPKPQPSACARTPQQVHTARDWVGPLMGPEEMTSRSVTWKPSFRSMRGSQNLCVSAGSRSQPKSLSTFCLPTLLRRS